MSIGHGSGEIDRAWLDELAAQIDAETTLVTTFNVPLGGGSSVDGKTIYMDAAIPKTYVQKGGQSVDASKYLRIHEFVEKRLIDAGIRYLAAHASATATELAAVQDDGLDVGQYDRFWDQWLKVAARHKLGDGTPPDIDKHAYEES